MGKYVNSAANDRYKKYNDRLAVHYGGSSSANNTVKTPTVKPTTTVQQNPTPTAATPTVQQNTTQATQSAAPAVSANTFMDTYMKALEQRNKAVNDGYNRNSSAINSWYGSSKGNLQSSFDSGRSTLEAQQAAQKEALRKQKEEANRQAYITSMKAERDIDQNMSAQGLSGGASETTRASLRNNYGNHRNSNEENYMDGVTELNVAYDAAYADLLNQYNSLMNALDDQRAYYTMQNENARSNNTVAGLDNFNDNITNLEWQKYSTEANQAFQREMANMQHNFDLENMAEENKWKKDFQQWNAALNRSGGNSKNNSYYYDDYTGDKTIQLSQDQINSMYNALSGINSRARQIDVENALRNAGYPNEVISAFLSSQGR